VILLVIDGLLAVAIGQSLGLESPTILADIMFAEAAALLVVGGIVGIFTLSPSLHRVKKYFDDRYEARSGMDVQKPPEAHSDQSDEKAEKKPVKVDRTAQRIVTWALLLLVLSIALSIALVYGP